MTGEEEHVGEASKFAVRTGQDCCANDRDIELSLA